MIVSISINHQFFCFYRHSFYKKVLILLSNPTRTPDICIVCEACTYIPLRASYFLGRYLWAVRNRLRARLAWLRLWLFSKKARTLPNIFLNGFSKHLKPEPFLYYEEEVTNSIFIGFGSDSGTLIHEIGSGSRISRFCQTIYEIALALTKNIYFQEKLELELFLDKPVSCQMSTSDE